MKNEYSCEINMWRWLLGLPLAAIAIIVAFSGRLEFSIPIITALITIYLLLCFIYIPIYYAAFSVEFSGRAVIITKGVIVKNQIILPSGMQTVFERVSIFPFSLFGAGVLLVRARGVLVTFPVMKNEKITQMIKGIKND